MLYYNYTIEIRKEDSMKEQLEAFRQYLKKEERAGATIEKYARDVRCFLQFLDGHEPSKEDVLAYKEYLCQQYAPTSVNAALSSLNGFFKFLGRQDLKVKNLKIQKNIFSSEEKELSKNEYERLVESAIRTKNERLSLVLQTICSTGIRVSELSYITVSAIGRGIADIDCKGKRRRIFLPSRLCKILRIYVNKKKIKRGPVFVTKNGRPLDRSNIWAEMKKLCIIAGVPEGKVFPHNLRHLFARTYYKIQKDIVKLADILGHTNINTTRIYTMESGEAHRRQIEKLGFLRC